MHQNHLLPYQIYSCKLYRCKQINAAFLLCLCLPASQIKILIKSKALLCAVPLYRCTLPKAWSPVGRLRRDEAGGWGAMNFERIEAGNMPVADDALVAKPHTPSADARSVDQPGKSVAMIRRRQNYRSGNRRKRGMLLSGPYASLTFPSPYSRTDESVHVREGSVCRPTVSGLGSRYQAVQFGQPLFSWTMRGLRGGG
jgi:hypothetical protein